MPDGQGSTGHVADDLGMTSLRVLGLGFEVRVQLFRVQGLVFNGLGFKVPGAFLLDRFFPPARISKLDGLPEAVCHVSTP